MVGSLDVGTDIGPAVLLGKGKREKAKGKGEK